MADVKEIVFDADAIKREADNLDSLGKQLNEAKEALKTSIQGVKDGWDGKGADKFDELLTNDWAVVVDRYCELMDMLVEIMNDVATTYSNMQIQIEGLRYEGK